MRDKQVFRTIVRLATTGTAAAGPGSIADPDDGNNEPHGRDSTPMPDGVYPFYTTVSNASPVEPAADRQLLEDASDASLYAIRNQNADVTFKVDIDPVPAAAPNIDADVDHVTYAAASKQDITFRFVAGNTAIKGGTFSFRIPSGWTTPRIVDADA